MNVVRGLSATPIGCALIAYFLDLPRWTLLNILFSVSLIPFLGAVLNGNTDWWVILLTSPIVIVGGGMANMAARLVKGDAPRWRDAFATPATYGAALAIWIGVVIALLFMSAQPALIFIVCALVLALLMIGVFALFIPPLLNVKGWLIWRNALVLTVHFPIVALGLLALSGVGVWAIWISRGALLLVVPMLWMMIAAYSVQDRINAIQAATQPN